jgi:hypothetical protein
LVAVQKNIAHTPSITGAMNAYTIAIIRPYESTGAKKPDRNIQNVVVSAET